MPEKKFNPVVIFFLIGLTHLVSLFFSIPVLAMITKPLIMPAIAFYLTISLKKYRINWPFLLFGAILFSWFGDMALLISPESEVWFMIGLGSFLLTQVFYILLFLKTSEARESGGSILFHLSSGLIVITYSTTLWLILRPGLGSLQVPVAVYTLALTGMVVSAIFRYKRTNRQSFLIVLGGAILFLISDSLIAINKFLEPLPLSGIWVMSTYMIGQWLISRGILYHYPEPGG